MIDFDATHSGFGCRGGCRDWLKSAQARDDHEFAMHQYTHTQQVFGVLAAYNWNPSYVTKRKVVA